MNFRKITVMALAITLSLSSFAHKNNNAGNDKVQNAFTEKFDGAKDVSWNATASYIKATFTLNGQSMFAFYTPDGVLVGVTRNIASPSLPIRLNAELKKSARNGWISELFEYASDDESSYYATVETADQKVFLKSASNGWSVLKKEKKN